MALAGGGLNRIDEATDAADGSWRERVPLLGANEYFSTVATNGRDLWFGAFQTVIRHQPADNSWTRVLTTGSPISAIAANAGGDLCAASLEGLQCVTAAGEQVKKPMSLTAGPVWTAEMRSGPATPAQ